MKLQAAYNDEIQDIDVRRDGDRVFATVGGRSYELESSEPEPNIYLLKHEGRIFEVFVTPQRSTGEPVNVRVGTHELKISLIDTKRLRSTAANAENSEGVAEIRSAMPGKVVRILVSAGAEVKKGDGVIVVEAMKMQNELRSPKDGVVREIRASDGATVNAGDVLAIVE